MLRKIPHTMSTQHPDNACIPHWSKDNIIKGDAEVHEAHFAYNTLGCQEVMWDSEGKDADTRVIRKLLANHGEYFKKNILGRDIFLTYRLPNPRVETTERKIVVETLENVPVGCDVASAFYKKEVIPIFELILPFTVESKELICLYNYYKKAIAGIGDIDLTDSMKIKDWIGPFKPKCIELIPLVEDMEGLLNIDKIVEQYVNAVKPRHIRAFIARSDPALNYGLVSTMVLTKIALSKLKAIEKKKNIPIYPIIGVGCMPFRGHLSPTNLKNFLNEYKGVYTATIQSGLKYDFPVEDVIKVVNTLNEKLPNGEANFIEPAEEKILIRILEKFKLKYQIIVEDLAPLITSIVPYIPKRRARKLHIGLFGYNRNMAGIALPRAITFAASLYSLGLPPELMGLEALNSLSEEEWTVLKRYYVNLESDLHSITGYFSWQNFNMLMEMCQVVAKRVGMEEGKLKSGLSKFLVDLQVVEEQLGIKLGSINLTQKKYENTISNFLIYYMEQNNEKAKDYLEEAARLRKSLG